MTTRQYKSLIIVNVFVLTFIVSSCSKKASDVDLEKIAEGLIKDRCSKLKIRLTKEGPDEDILSLTESTQAKDALETWAEQCCNSGRSEYCDDVCLGKKYTMGCLPPVRLDYVKYSNNTIKWRELLRKDMWRMSVCDKRSNYLISLGCSTIAADIVKYELMKGAAYQSGKVDAMAYPPLKFQVKKIIYFDTIGKEHPNRCYQPNISHAVLGTNHLECPLYQAVSILNPYYNGFLNLNSENKCTSAPDYLLFGEPLYDSYCKYKCKYQNFTNEKYCEEKCILSAFLSFPGSMGDKHTLLIKNATETLLLDQKGLPPINPITGGGITSGVSH